MRGRFITFEGGEGSGKSTQAQRLAARLTAVGYDVLVTREPGGTAFAEIVRRLILDPETPEHSALSEALLFYAARADHLERVIRPALTSGRTVICDRFSDSTRVYQSLVGGLPERTIAGLEALVVAPTRPMLTLMLDLDPAVGLARAEARRTSPPAPEPPSIALATAEAGSVPQASPVTASGAAIGAPPARDRYEARSLDFHARLRTGFLDIAQIEPHRCAVVDAAHPADAVADAIWRIVQVRLGIASAGAPPPNAASGA